MIHGKPEFIGILHLLRYKKMNFFIKFLTWKREIPFNAKLILFSHKQVERILR